MILHDGFKTLGGTELEVMLILWEHGTGSVRDVTEAIRQRRAIGYTYTTVAPLLARLAEQGLLAEESTSPSGYSYTPLVTKEELIAHAVRKLVTDLQLTPQERGRALTALG
jgi:predicted transcriptional regulator